MRTPGCSAAPGSGERVTSHLRLSARGWIAVGVLLTGAGAGLSPIQSAAAHGPPVSSPAQTPAVSPLPVLGSTVITQRREADGARATALVHGVRRIHGATVLYFSVGLPAGAPHLDWVQLGRTQTDRRYSIDSTDLGSQQVIDMAGHRVYSVLIDAQKEAMASPKEAWPFTGPPGQFYTLYQVLPELPASVSTVDVLIGNGDVVHDVPVSNGVLEPAVEQTGPLPLGQGWPKIDQRAAQNSVRPQDSIRALEITSSDLEKTVTKRSTREGVESVDLSADVLFALDSATLGPAAAGKVRLAADQINAHAAAGRIQVVGHTDNTGTTGHNVHLSRLRAQSVAKALMPQVTLAGVTFEIQGAGENNPVATNSTSAGRKENRRVSVVFAPKEGTS